MLFLTAMLEKTLESPLDCKENQPIHPKRDQSWVFIGRTDVEAETPVLWPPDVKNWLIWKGPDAGKDWGQEEKRMTEDEMVGWHHWFNGHGFGWTLGVDDRQGSLACCNSWGRKESDTTEWLNWTERHNKTLVEYSFLTRDQALRLWSGSTDSKTLDYQRINPREHQIVRAHTKETIWIQDPASLNHQ